MAAITPIRVVRAFLDSLALDIRYGLRALARNRAFMSAAVVALALGIGATSAIFTIINATLLRPLDFGSPERIVRLVPRDPQGSESDLTFALADLTELSEHATTLESVAAYDGWLATLEGPSGAERIQGAFVSTSYFEVLGVQPRLGRFFSPDDSSASGEPVVVLSDEMWRTRFASSPSVVGERIRLSGIEHTIIGVAPHNLEDPELSRGSREVPLFWRPPPRSWTTGNRAEHGYRSVTAVARLAPGSTLQASNSEVAAIFARLAAAFPQTNRGWGARLVPLKEYILAPVRGALLLVSVASALVILIACANVANLMLARGSRRQREFAVRLALGASRGRIGRQLLVESIVLSVLAGTIGVVIAWFATRLILQVGAGQLPRLAGVAVDASTIWFAFAISLITALIFGVLPASRASGNIVHSVLQSTDLHAAGGKRQSHVRNLLITSEVALAVVLLFGAGLLVRSLWQLYAVDTGIDAAGVLTARLEISGRYFDTESRVSEALGRITRAVSGVPGVESAGLVNVLPFSGGYWHTSFAIQGQVTGPTGDDEPDAELRTASPGFFSTMGVTVRSGRVFDSRDVSGAAPVVVINRTLAEHYLPGVDPVGRFILHRDSLREIVGVIENVRQFALDRAPEPVIYLPEAQAPSWLTRNSYLVVRTTGDALAAAPNVRASVRAVDRAIPVSDVRAMDDVIGLTTSPQRFRTLLLTLLGALAFALAIVGVYGVVAYAVSQRTREIGIRMALGARARDVARLLIRQEMRPVIAGILIGVAGALATGRLLAGFLFGITTTDITTLVAVPLLLAITAFLATLLPASRAARVDPVITLRNE